ncbi:hypothetical protein ACO02O_06335 [Dirofilaria immitis]
MTTAEMMNVVLLSCGRNKRWKRNSIAVFDHINNLADINNVDDNNPLHLLMLHSLQHKNVNEQRLPENCCDRYVIRRLAKSTDGITIADLELLRKTFMERFANCKEHSERIYELKSAICAINEIKICSCDSQWLTQYQYLLNWCYCQIRFISNPAERFRLFLEVKEKYRKMFEMLKNVDDVDKLTSYLHWSQLCYQYAELADRESLSWSIDAVINAKNALLVPSSRSSTLSSKTNNSNGSYRSSISNINGNEQIESIGIENQRRVKIATIGLIQSNVLKAENIYVCSLKKRLNATS